MTLLENSTMPARAMESQNCLPLGKLVGTVQPATLDVCQVIREAVGINIAPFVTGNPFCQHLHLPTIEHSIIPAAPQGEAFPVPCSLQPLFRSDQNERKLGGWCHPSSIKERTPSAGSCPYLCSTSFFPDQTHKKGEPPLGKIRERGRRKTFTRQLPIPL